MRFKATKSTVGIKVGREVNRPFGFEPLETRSMLAFGVGADFFDRPTGPATLDWMDHGLNPTESRASFRNGGESINSRSPRMLGSNERFHGHDSPTNASSFRDPSVGFKVQINSQISGRLGFEKSLPSNSLGAGHGHCVSEGCWLTGSARSLGARFDSHIAAASHPDRLALSSLSLHDQDLNNETPLVSTTIVSEPLTSPLAKDQQPEPAITFNLNASRPEPSTSFPVPFRRLEPIGAIAGQPNIGLANDLGLVSTGFTTLASVAVQDNLTVILGPISTVDSVEADSMSRFDNSWGELYGGSSDDGVSLTPLFSLPLAFEMTGYGTGDYGLLVNNDDEIPLDEEDNAEPSDEFTLELFDQSELESIWQEIGEQHQEMLASESTTTPGASGYEHADIKVSSDDSQQVNLALTNDEIMDSMIAFDNTSDTHPGLPRTGMPVNSTGGAVDDWQHQSDRSMGLEFEATIHVRPGQVFEVFADQLPTEKQVDSTVQDEAENDDDASNVTDADSTKVSAWQGTVAVGLLGCHFHKRKKRQDPVSRK